MLINSRTVNLKGIAPEKREFTLPYDKLVVAVGAVNNTFGTPGVEQNCIFLKELSGQIEIIIDYNNNHSYP
jgi:NADH:ubiquinone reductase (non-electrogenic)